jgi:hypothetical protein
MSTSDSRHFNKGEVMNFLKGYKTYIVAILSAVVTSLHAMGKIDDVTKQFLLELLAAGAAMTVAAKINRLSNRIQ